MSDEIQRMTDNVLTQIESENEFRNQNVILRQKLSESERILKIISEFPVSEGAMLIPQSGKVLRQIAINYFINSAMQQALAEHAALRSSRAGEEKP